MQVHKPPPVYNEFIDDNLNDAVWNVAGDYKFTPKVAGKYNPDVKTRAILPENTREAAFLRHDPYVSNYNKVLNTSRINAEEEKLMRAGLLPKFKKEPYDDMGHYAKLFPTMNGGYGDIGNSSKAVIIDELERKFPGYREVMAGNGPGQKAYSRTPDYMLHMDLTDSWIDQMRTAESADDINIFYNTVREELEDAICESEKKIAKYKAGLQGPASDLAERLIAREEDAIADYRRRLAQADKNYGIGMGMITERAIDNLD